MAGTSYSTTAIDESTTKHPYKIHPVNKLILSILGVSWAIFQLLLPSVIIINTITARSIHLGFAVVIGFLGFPSVSQTIFERIKKLTFLKPWKWLVRLGLALSAGSVMLYLMLDWEGIALRSGLPSILDYVFGVLIIILLLEATRRSIGIALPLIAVGFSIYVFYAPYFPSFMAFRAVSLTKYITQLTLSTEGIFGIPIGVSVSVVYLFVLFGSLLEKAGAGQFFIDCCLALLGRFKGGPAKAAVVASGLMGMLSGSSIANIVTTGTFTIPLMKKVGYPPKKAAAIEVAASTDGQLMPPIMGAAAFIIAEYVNIPYVEVVKAALIPALASNIALLYITHLEAEKAGIKGLMASECPTFLSTLKSGLHYLVPIGMLILELFWYRHSPALAVFRTIMVLIGIIFLQECQRLNFKKGVLSGIKIIKDGMVAGSTNMVPVALACASAGIVVGLVNIGIGGMITQIVEVLSQGNFMLILVITALASLLLGMGLPTTATYIVMASLTAPIIVELGTTYEIVVPLIAAHLFCFYFGILADDTPPVGLAAYAAAAIAKTPPLATCIQGFLYDIRTAIIPFMFMFNTDILLLGISSWPLGFLVLVMTALGACAFTSIVQGWCFRQNSWVDTLILAVSTLSLFYPQFFVDVLGIQHISGYWFYCVGIMGLVGVWFRQHSS